MGGNTRITMVALGFSALLIGCSEGEAPSTKAEPSWGADVAPIVQSKCSGCHNGGGVGGFPLETYAQVSAVAHEVADAVENERMPPWGADASCNDYKADLSLTEDEKDVISDWVAAGAPRGTEPLSNTMPLTAGQGMERVDLSIASSAAYTPADGDDDYRCFPMDWPIEHPTYVTGYEVVPGELSLVHHVIAYILPGTYRDEVEAKVQEDGRPGYSCFGGPGVVEQRDAEWLGGWAPGGEGRTFPEGTGIAMEPDSIVLLQVHYHTDGREIRPDQTRVDVMVDDSVETEAWIQPFANPFWLYGEQMDIPAGSENHEETFSYKFDDGATIFSANLHMHLLGQHAQLSIEHQDGSETCLLNVPQYDFNWQRTYHFQEEQVIGPGDQLKLSCFFDNPTDAAVNWGDETTDEMCLATMYMID